MKQLFILTVLIICSFAGNGQTSKYSVEVNISTRVDTTYNKDKKEIYHLGASLKDLGKKWFAFSKFEIENLKILDYLK